MTKSRFQKRLGNCYEYVNHYVLEHPDCEVVHGTIQRDPLPPNPHAWVEWDTGDSSPFLEDTFMVWEPIWEQALPRPAFYAMFHATEHHRYDREAASKAMLATKHHGPWDGDYFEVVKEGRRKAVKHSGGAR